MVNTGIQLYLRSFLNIVMEHFIYRLTPSTVDSDSSGVDVAAGEVPSVSSSRRCSWQFITSPTVYTIWLMPCLRAMTPEAVPTWADWRLLPFASCCLTSFTKKVVHQHTSHTRDDSWRLTCATLNTNISPHQKGAVVCICGRQKQNQISSSIAEKCPKSHIKLCKLRPTI